MKNKSNKILILLLIVIVTITGCEGKHINEWVTKNGKKYYYDETGHKVIDVVKEIDGNKYYFDNNGELRTGFAKIDDEIYYFDDGKTLSGKVKINDDYYCLNDDGKVLTGWQEIDGTKYHFGADGKMNKGIVFFDGKKYYFDENGLPSSGWVKHEGDYYFLDDNSIVLTGWQQDGVDWYYLDGYGIMQKSKWINNKGNKYYVDNNGKMLVNTQERIDSVDYVFDATGVSKKIKNIWDKYYYVDDFGEKTNEAYVQNYPRFKGEFSNSATTNSKCEFKFLIDNKGVNLMIYEYESYQVKGEEDYSCSLRLDNGYTVNFSGSMYSDRVSFDYTGKTAILNCLKGNENFKLYLKEKSRYGIPSTYRFEVEPDNFKYVWWN